MTESTPRPLERSFDALSVRLDVPSAQHPLPVIYGAAVCFIDRCFVFVDRGDETFAVTLTAKESVIDEGALAHLADAFEQGLAASDLHHRIAQDTRVLNEAVVAQAFGASSGAAPSVDELAAFDFSDDAFDDPLGIAQTWEAKHNKPAPQAPAQASTADGEKSEDR